MIDKIDYHVRVQILKSRSHDKFWNALKLSLEEQIIEKQREVNDLATQGEMLFQCRVELKLLQDFASGLMIDAYVSDLEIKAEEQEEFIQENIKELKENQKVHA